MTRDELRDKVEWEGGVWATLQYGIRAANIDDPEVAKLWREMESLFEKTAPIAWRIATILDEHES